MRKDNRSAVIALIVGVIGVVILGDFVLLGGTTSSLDSPLHSLLKDSGDAVNIVVMLIGAMAQFGFIIAIVFFYNGHQEKLKAQKNKALESFDVIVDGKRWLGSEATIIRVVAYSPPKSEENIDNEKIIEEFVGKAASFSSSISALFQAVNVFNFLFNSEKDHYIGISKKENWFLIKKSTILTENINLIPVSLDEAKLLLEPHKEDYVQYFGDVEIS